jgi:hypothetical protein
MKPSRETRPIKNCLYSWLLAVGIGASLLLMLTADLQAANALPPTVIEFKCPDGTTHTKMVEITEDQDGDGVYDTRTTMMVERPPGHGHHNRHLNLRREFNIPTDRISHMLSTHRHTTQLRDATRGSLECMMTRLT